MWLCHIVATIGGLCRRVEGFSESMYGFWDYWKHNILLQTRLTKSEDFIDKTKN
jgi:prenyltransferase beta subunit